MAKDNLTIIIPAYSGLDTIKGVVDSIKNQAEAINTHIIIVIDGPSDTLKEIVSTIDKSKFKSVKIKQFKINKGRFEARYEGALLAGTEKLLFIDDRTEMTKNYLYLINKLGKEHRVIISNILEKNQPNFVSMTMHILRKRLYKSWGDSFQSYNITEDNFDKSAKGTAGLYIDKDTFILAATQFMKQTEVNKSSNDDTKLLRLVLRTTPLFRSSEPTLLYSPRKYWQDELIHIYRRGPMFVDYYLRWSSPYFWYLILLYTLLFISIITAIAFTSLLLWGFISLVVAAFSAGAVIGNRLSDKVSLGLGILCIPIYFVAGIYVGTLKKLVKYN